MLTFKKLRRNYRVLCLSLLLFLSSCNEVFETNIEGKTVSIVAPVDSLSSTSNQITFLWLLLEGADVYNIQIATPSFSNLQSIVADTNVANDYFTLTLQEGNYEWRIRAENSAYIGDYSYRVFQIVPDTSGSINP